MPDEILNRGVTHLVLSQREIDPKIIEDLATVKAQLDSHKNDRQESIQRDEQIIREIKQLRAEMNRMKTFIGGIAFVFTGIGTVAGTAISYFANVGH